VVSKSLWPGKISYGFDGEIIFSVFVLGIIIFSSPMASERQKVVFKVGEDLLPSDVVSFS
jgi:hypothetical protein